MAILEGLQAENRRLVNQLTADLGWLESHARSHPEQARHQVQLRMAAALVRNCLGPFLQDAPPGPLHLVVVGGAGAGKSTVTNFLTGAVVAEANPQAGFTRHPIAYTSTNGPLQWTQQLGFLGPLNRLFEPRPSNLDADVYQVRTVRPAADDGSVLTDFVVWDCPDMTTWQASGYVSRLVEVAALADLIVYVASDERYNDEVPTQFLQMLLQAGKPVITCVVKMREPNAQAIIDHFRKTVVAQIPECTRVAACLAIPHLTPQELADPVHRAARYRQPLLDQVAWWASRRQETRKAAVRGAVQFLENYRGSLLSVAQEDLVALQTWRDLVERGRAECEARYQREYLSNENFPRFNEALVRILQLLELPGIGQYLSYVMWGIRTPYRLLKELVLKVTGTPPPARIPEEPILEAALQGWLNGLRKEAAVRRDTHGLWGHVEKGYQQDLPAELREHFQKCIREFHVGLAAEVEHTAQSIYKDLEQKPMLLNTLRGIKFTTEVASIGSIIIACGLSPWDLLILLVTPLIQEITEFFGKQYVETQKERARERQMELLQRTVTGPLAEWLIAWPATGGSTYERLQAALRQIPQDIAAVARAVHVRLGDAQA